MIRFRLIRRPVILLTLAGIVACLAAFARPGGDLAVAIDDSFSAPSPVEIAGYAGDAMEPFVTRDGRWLLFNTRNGPKDQTDLMLARRIDDTHFAFVGPLAGANSSSLDGVASVDRSGHFFFVSNRDYDRTGNTLWSGSFADGQVRDVSARCAPTSPRASCFASTSTSRSAPTATSFTSRKIDGTCSAAAPLHRTSPSPIGQYLPLASHFSSAARIPTHFSPHSAVARWIMRRRPAATG